ncbi:hypothetical protein D9756_006325 [Leucocoprinus leucothites]|uniref:Transmembrane protein n=1 Tax=Leucocoprinus leucothites TaxID=201217 RepID=A0A8H5FXJ8_9AGAR|nr:hypothetical protein D9756_006325 [Leucoagaricus leucothites]
MAFTRMRKPSIAIEWAFEARNPRSAFWSVGILLSLPVVWLAWSIVAFIVCIMAFMWRCNANPPDQFPVPPSTELAFRIFVSAVLAIGCLYGILIYNSFQRYGPQMDEALSRRIDTYIASASSSSTLISQSIPEPYRSPDSPSFEKPHKQKSRNRKSRSTSPSVRPASPSPLVNRSVSLGQNPSTIPYQPSPLSNSTAVPQPERQVSTSGAKPSDASQDKLDPKLLLKVASTRKPRPPPNDVSNDDAPRYEQAQSTRSGRILTASPRPAEEIRQEQAPGNDHILYDPQMPTSKRQAVQFVQAPILASIETPVITGTSWNDPHASFPPPTSKPSKTLTRRHMSYHHRRGPTSGHFLNPIEPSIIRPNFGSEIRNAPDPTTYSGADRVTVERDHAPSWPEYHGGGPSAPVEINEGIRDRYQGHPSHVYPADTVHQNYHTPAPHELPPSSTILGEPDNWARVPQPDYQHDNFYNFPAGPAGYDSNPWHWGDPNPHATIDHDNFASHYSFVVTTTVYNVISQGYLVGHLLVPSLYFFRANQIFRDAGLSAYQIAYHTVQSHSPVTEPVGRSRTRARKPSREKREKSQEDEEEGDEPTTVPRYRRLKENWGNMIDDLVEEWRTLNIVSAMMVPGILTLFQVDGAANDPVTRSLAYWSLIMALWSLVYGCLYVVQFRRMRTDYTIIGWAMETKKPHSIIWNTWVMLALPVVSLAWSILIFITAIIWFMWRTRANPPPEFSLSAPPLTEPAFRILTSAFLAIAINGAPMTGHWKREVEELIAVVEAQLRLERLKRSQAKRAERRKKAKARGRHDKSEGY